MKQLAFIFILVIIVVSSCENRNVFTIYASPSEVKAGHDVLFSSSHQGANWSYSWDLGDGNNASSNNGETHHTYQQQGSYVVVLSINDDTTYIGMTSIRVDVK